MVQADQVDGELGVELAQELPASAARAHVGVLKVRGDGDGGEVEDALRKGGGETELGVDSEQGVVGEQGVDGELGVDGEQGVDEQGVECGQ